MGHVIAARTLVLGIAEAVFAHDLGVVGPGPGELLRNQMGQPVFKVSDRAVLVLDAIDRIGSGGAEAFGPGVAHGKVVVAVEVLAIANGGRSANAKVWFSFVGQVKIVRHLQPGRKGVRQIEHHAIAVIRVFHPWRMVQILKHSEINSQIPWGDLVVVAVAGPHAALHEIGLDVFDHARLVVERVVATAGTNRKGQRFLGIEVGAVAKREETLGRHSLNSCQQPEGEN